MVIWEGTKAPGERDNGCQRAFLIERVSLPSQAAGTTQSLAEDEFPTLT